MKYGLIGGKLGHSLSQKIYNKCGLEYSMIELNVEELQSFIDKKVLTAFNVTIPYKQQIMPLLDSISVEATEIGAVNTVYLRGNKWYGDNTDIYGMELAIDKIGISLQNQNVLILGTGGTSNTAEYLAKIKGAKSINKVSRTGVINYDNCYELVDTNVIIDTTPVGMFPNNTSTSVDLGKFPNLNGVFDCVYNPLNTNIVLQAKELGIKASGGLYMLVAQAVKSMSIFNDTNVDVALIDSIYKELLMEFSNIVLIGMPSSGKSTIGEIVASKLNKKFVDVDKMFFTYYRTTPANEIMFNGEDSFRLKETAIVKKLNTGGNVIATGGGTILRKENIDFLKQNGILVYIDRDINKLSLSDRPLSQMQGVKELYRVRKPLYEKYCDYMVTNDNLEDAVKGVINGYEKNIGN